MFLCIRYFLIIVFLVPFFAHSQFKQDTTRKVHYFAIPIVISTPETGWAFGLNGSITFRTTHHSDTLTRTSSIQLFGIFSLREQNIQGIDANIYFPGEKYILYLNSGHSYFPDRFWGIGQETKNEAMEKYIYEQLNFVPHLKRKITGRFFMGAIADYQNVFKIQYPSNGLFDSLSFLGKSEYQVFGLGLSASYDSRNSAFWPTKGLFVQTQFLSYNKELNCDFSFNKWVTDIRYFKKVFKNHVIACQLYNYTTVGNTPYRSMGMLGGPDNLRGFYQGRYIENSMYSAIIEYRAPVYWRFSAVAFGGIGDVYNQPKNINIRTLKYSFGGGIRFTVQKKDKLNIRIDYGYSDNYNQGFYFTITEAF